MVEHQSLVVILIKLVVVTLDIMELILKHMDMVEMVEVHEGQAQVVIEDFTLHLALMMEHRFIVTQAQNQQKMATLVVEEDQQQAEGSQMVVVPTWLEEAVGLGDTVQIQVEEQVEEEEMEVMEMLLGHSQVVAEEVEKQVLKVG